jgi:hypothetical protein
MAASNQKRLVSRRRLISGAVLFAVVSTALPYCSEPWKPVATSAEGAEETIPPQNGTLSTAAPAVTR